MPALSSSPRGPALYSSSIYVLFGIVLILLALGALFSRLRRHFSRTTRSQIQTPTMEKAPLLSPAQGPSFMNPPLRFPGPYSSKAPGPPLSQPPSQDVVDLDIPRRRSYTKITPAGTEINGEIIVAEGWRRHTKVFGGGVCAACEENERRLAKVMGGPGAPNVPAPTAGLA
jgi:hypothetical protein